MQVGLWTAVVVPNAVARAASGIDEIGVSAMPHLWRCR